MNPRNYVDCIYRKNGSIKALAKEDEWVPIYLNKIFAMDRDCAEAMNTIIKYNFYISPTHYFYLLYLLIPKKFIYTIPSVKKFTEDKDEDALVTNIRKVLGWSKKEYKLNEKQVKETILNDKTYWSTEMGLNHVKRKRKSKKV